jgi:phosphoribosyl-AMP cyclohydrolase
MINRIKWNNEGLITAVAQEKDSKDILMLAWMNKESLIKTIATKQAVYWSRSRNKLWHKGEDSGCFQYVHSIHLDCDMDAIVLTITQKNNIACHTGRRSCFFYSLNLGEDNLEWYVNQEIKINLAK